MPSESMAETMHSNIAHGSPLGHKLHQNVDWNMLLDLTLNSDARTGLALSPNLTMTSQMTMTPYDTRFTCNVVIAVVSFVMFFIFLMTCSPIRGVSSTRDARYQSSLQTQCRRVLLPYWAPSKVQNVILFSCVLLCIVCMSGGSIGILAIVLYARIISVAVPNMYLGLPTGLIFSPTFVCTLVGLSAVFPAAYILSPAELRSRGTQWVILCLQFALMFFDHSVIYITSFVSRDVANIVLAHRESEYWQYVLSVVPLHVGVTLFQAAAWSFVSRLLYVKWRVFLSNHIVDSYFDNNSYWWLDSNADHDNVLDNPDARIQTDVGEFITDFSTFFYTIFDVVMGLTVTCLVLHNVFPLWTVYVVVYAFASASFATWFMWVMAKLSYECETAEADLRFSLLNVRNRAEAIAFYNAEEAEQNLAKDRLEKILTIRSSMVRTNAWVVFIESLMGNAGTKLPDLMVVKSYFSGRIDLGMVFQLIGAFGELSRCLNFVTRISPKVTDLAVRMARLSTLIGKLNSLPPESGVTITETAESQIKMTDLSLHLPNSKHELIANLTLSVGAAADCQRLLIVARSGVGKSSLLRCIAALWPSATGRILRPQSGKLMFLPQKPFMTIGTFRQQLLYPLSVQDKTKFCPAEEEQVSKLLRDFGMSNLLDRFAAGYEQTEDWSRVLSLGEQQKVAAIRIILRAPQIIMLDEATSALSKWDQKLVYDKFLAMRASCISVGHRLELVEYHDAVLKVKGGGPWVLYSPAEFKALPPDDDADA